MKEFEELQEFRSSGVRIERVIGEKAPAVER
jgi:hypothetical protein